MFYKKKMKIFKAENFFLVIKEYSIKMFKISLSRSSNTDRRCNDTSKTCYGPGAPGLNQHCYNTGFDHGSKSISPDPVGEGIASFPCTLRKNANDCYAKGIMDARYQSGVSAGDSTSNNQHNNGGCHRSTQHQINNDYSEFIGVYGNIIRKIRNKNHNPLDPYSYEFDYFDKGGRHCQSDGSVFDDYSADVSDDF